VRQSECAAAKLAAPHGPAASKFSPGDPKSR